VDVAVVDHDALTAGGARQAVAQVPEQPGGGVVAIYRGWMLRSEQYATFAEALTGRGVMLRTSAEQYRRPTSRHLLLTGQLWSSKRRPPSWITLPRSATDCFVAASRSTTT
jgi:hypothetical protein